MRDDRYSAEWPAPDARLRLTEPTMAEVRAAAPALADYYNEPTNRALMTNDIDHSADDVIEQFEEMWEDGDRPFLLYVDDVLVGDGDLRNIEGGHAEYAVLVGPRSSQAKGLGTRFSIMTLALSFGPLALCRVYASVRPENAGSLRMFGKVGYAIDTSPEARRYAEEDDDVCLSIGAEAFRGKHAQALAQIRIGPRDKR
jgi:RimJ/RimL family protein N-acetyltransferase